MGDLIWVEARDSDEPYPKPTPKLDEPALDDSPFVTKWKKLGLSDSEIAKLQKQIGESYLTEF